MKELVILKVEVACIGIIDTHQLHLLTRRVFKLVKHFIGSMANTPMKDIDTNLIPNTNRSIRGLLISILKILNQKTRLFIGRSGGVRGRVVNTSNSGSGGPGFKPRPSRCFLRQGTLLYFVSLHPGD